MLIMLFIAGLYIQRLLWALSKINQAEICGKCGVYDGGQRRGRGYFDVHSVPKADEKEEEEKNMGPRIIAEERETG